MEWSVIAQCISTLGLCATIIISILNFRKGNRDKDESHGEKIGLMVTRLEYIQTGVDEIKTKLNKHDDSLTSIIQTVSVLEQRVNALERNIR